MSMQTGSEWGRRDGHGVSAVTATNGGIPTRRTQTKRSCPSTVSCCGAAGPGNPPHHQSTSAPYRRPSGRYSITLGSSTPAQTPRDRDHDPWWWSYPDCPPPAGPRTPDGSPRSSISRSSTTSFRWPGCSAPHGYPGARLTQSRPPRSAPARSLRRGPGSGKVQPHEVPGICEYPS